MDLFCLEKECTEYRAGSGNKCNSETNHQGKGMYRVGEGLFRAGQGIKKKALISPDNFLEKNSKPHPLTNFEIQDYYKNEPRFNRVYSRNNLPRTIKNGAYIILDEYTDTGTHWIALH